MVEGWKIWEGKKVFIILKNKRQYQGEVLEVEINNTSSNCFITILDKFGNRISFVNTEIELIQEERNIEK